jgi:hypothetical protein
VKALPVKATTEILIELLKDGKWHTLEEMSRRARLHEFKVQVLAEFLADYSFLELNKKERRARSSKAFETFLKSTGATANWK